MEMIKEVTRFILESNKIRKTTPPSPKPAAFEPNFENKLSVFIKDNIGEDVLWETGERVAEDRTKTLYGRADVDAKEIIKQKLKIVKSQSNYDIGHADIIDWPLAREVRLDIKHNLAAAASDTTYYSPNSPLLD